MGGMTKRESAKPLLTARIDRELLERFDDAVRHSGISSRTQALELLMRAFNKGTVKLPKPIGFDPITNQPIWERSK